MRYLSIKLDVFLPMLPGETKQEAEDRLVDLINEGGDALVCWDAGNSIVEEDEDDD